MKVRTSFVSNSSSCSFIITNLSDKDLTLVDFVRENPHLITMFCDQYGYSQDKGFTQERLLESAAENNISFIPKRDTLCNFGDDDGTFIGGIFDYILREGGCSESFRWYLEDMNR